MENDVLEHKFSTDLQWEKPLFVPVPDTLYAKESRRKAIVRIISDEEVVDEIRLFKQN